MSDTEFEFTIIERIYGTEEYTEIVPKNIAKFIGDGTIATYETETYTLTFSFPAVAKELIASYITIRGLNELEDITYFNSNIEGQESG